MESPWLAEEELLSQVPLPLNLQGNNHSFKATLADIRRAARLVALTLDVVVDNGGPRRVSRSWMASSNTP
jgi:hypothetical protein